MGATAAIIGGAALAGSVGGALISSSGAQSAAQTQAQSAQAATNAQLGMFQQTQANLQPYVSAGYNNLGNLQSQIGSLTQPYSQAYNPGANPAVPQQQSQIGLQALPQSAFATQNSQFQTPAPFNGGAQFNFQPTQQQLEQTPGYQFTLQQGLKAVNNSNSAVGWGLSGAGQKGIAQYATGLADQTYQQQFNNALQGYQTNFNNNLSGYQTNFQTGLEGYQTNWQNANVQNQQAYQNNLNTQQTDFTDYWGQQQQNWNNAQTQNQTQFANQQTNFQNYLQQYQQGFSNDWAQQLNQYNILNGQSQQGQNAAAGLGGLSANVGNAIASNIIGGGNATASGQLATANAYSSVPQNALLEYQQLNNALTAGPAVAPGYNPYSYYNQSINPYSNGYNISSTDPSQTNFGIQL